MFPYNLHLSFITSIIIDLAPALLRSTHCPDSTRERDGAKANTSFPIKGGRRFRGVVHESYPLPAILSNPSGWSQTLFMTVISSFPSIFVTYSSSPTPSKSPFNWRGGGQIVASFRRFVSDVQGSVTGWGCSSRLRSRIVGCLCVGSKIRCR